MNFAVFVTKFLGIKRHIFPWFRPIPVIINFGTSYYILYIIYAKYVRKDLYIAILYNRWVCTSGNPVDLEKTDEIAKTVLLNAIGEGG